MKKNLLVLFILASTFSYGQDIIDSCFTSANPSVTFFGSTVLANAQDADLLEWTGSAWNGAWSTAQVNLAPPCDVAGVRAIWMGDQTSWTSGGEGFGAKLDQNLVAGTSYTFTFTYASNGLYSNGSFAPYFATNSSSDYLTSNFVATLTPVGYSWETHSISFTATNAQDGDNWIFIHSNNGSGIVLSQCSITGLLDLGPDTLLCNGDTMQLNGPSGYDTYNWSTGATTTSIQVISAGTYYLSAIAGQCTAVDTIVIGYIPCNVPQAAFVSNTTAVCEKFCVDFSDQSTNDPISWLWSFPGGVPSSSTLQDPTNICYQTPGTYDVSLIISNADGSDTLTLTNYITVNPTPPIPTITQSGYTLTSSVASAYQWQFNSVDIPGATNQSYDVQQSGYYSVIITDQNGCVTSGTIYVLIVGVNDPLQNTNLLIYPNPSDGNFIIQWNEANITGDHILIEIINAVSQRVFFSDEPSFTTNSPNYLRKIELSPATCNGTKFPAGVYFLQLRSGNLFLKRKIIVQ